MTSAKIFKIYRLLYLESRLFWWRKQGGIWEIEYPLIKAATPPQLPRQIGRWWASQGNGENEARLGGGLGGEAWRRGGKRRLEATQEGEAVRRGRRGWEAQRGSKAEDEEIRWRLNRSVSCGSFLSECVVLAKKRNIIKHQNNGNSLRSFNRRKIVGEIVPSSMW